MKRILLIIALMSLFLLPVKSLLAKVEIHDFQSNDQQQLYKKLSEQLRCLVCQNQNLADSNAELAQDMRLKTYQLVLENKSENQIIDYWVTRYGDFVLYNPPFKPSTFILWLGPFLLLILALLFGKRIIQNSNSSVKQSLDKTTFDKARLDKIAQADKKAHDRVKKLLSKDNK